MIVVISGTNRTGSNTLKVAKLARRQLEAAGENVVLIDLREMPARLFTPDAYGTKPPEFEPVQKAILEADGILTVTPEYNGSYPGVLKYFIDMLRFPESLVDMPAAFIGLASGEWGGLRPVEQLEMVFHYRHAHLYGRRLFLKGISKLLDEEGRLADPELARRLDELVTGFAVFCRKLRLT
jgi:chromate reductase, NAD(P)H dehydrogenase (quinone)